jgi:hypothetical protein
MNKKTEISNFADKQHITNDKIDESIKGIQQDSLVNSSHNGNNNNILNIVLSILKKIEEHQKNELNWFKSQKLATKNDLKETESKIMSKISEFAVSQSLFQDRMDVAVTDLQGDVQNLETQIAILQSSSGSISAKDQTLLDNIQARTSAIADKLDALDALTPPVVVPAA